MNNDKALIIVEATQSPQVVAVSDVSTAEIEYQRASRQCRDLAKQFEIAGSAYVAAQETLIKAWMTENYPDLSYTVMSRCTNDSNGLFVGISWRVDSPMQFTIIKEFNAYLDQLTT
jgi:hypothetical protein